MSSVFFLLYVSLHFVLLNLFPKDIFDLASVPRFNIRVEYMVDLFERSARRLWVGEKHLNGHDGAENAKDNIRFPLNVGKGGSNKVSQGKVEDPVCGG